MRACSRCGETKDLSEFYLDRGRPRADCKACVSAVRRAHYVANREAKMAYRRAHEPRARERARERYATDPDYRRRMIDRACDRQHMERAGGGGVTPEEWAAVLDRHDFRCAYCYAPWEHQDHKVPIALGGEHAPHNVVPSCSSCNLAKGAKPLEVFLAA